MGHRDPAGEPDEVHWLSEAARYAADEFRVALSWTPTKSVRELDFSDVLILTLPKVHGMFRTGVIDLPKARMLCHWLGGLPADEADRIFEIIAPEVAGWTTTKLAARLRRLVIGLDPEAAEQRYDRALADRAAVFVLDDNGTAALIVDGVAPDRADAAKANVTALARQLRRAGYPATLTQTRADVIMSLLDGSLEGLTRAQIIAELLDSRADERGRDTDTAQPAPAEPTAEPAEQQCPAPDHRLAGETVDLPPDGSTDAGEPLDQIGAPGERGGVLPRERGIARSAPGRVGRLGNDVRIELSTLLGYDQHPGELPGLGGPILGRLARRIVNTQRGCPWSVAVCDDDGYLLSAGLVRARPPESTDRHRGGQVEIQVPIGLLERLVAEPPAGWEGFVAEVRELHRQWPEILNRLDDRPGDRFPNGPLRRYIQIRDRYCRGPGGCSASARNCELDHTDPFHRGGATTSRNTGPQCPHDHDLKDGGLWILRQPEPGLFEWTSPLRQRYRTRGDPVIVPIPETPGKPPF